MKKFIPSLLILAILAGIGMANLGERRVYPLRPGLKYRFTSSRDPNNWWDDVNDVYIIHGELFVDDINLPGRFDVNDVNVTGDLVLYELTALRLLATDGDKIVVSVANLASWVGGTANEITITDDIDGTITIGITDPFVTNVLIIGSNVPSSGSDTGTAGTITYDSSYIYICTATNTWKKVALAAWGFSGDTMIYEDSNTMVFEDGNTMVYD